MTQTDLLLRNNEAYARTFKSRSLDGRPKRKLAVIACMDARLDLFKILGLEQGDAHVIRNAGGIVSDDVIRSLIISQHLLGTEEIVLVHHTDCGMLTFDEVDLRRRVESKAGRAPPFLFGAFSDLEKDVQLSKRRLRSSPFILKKDRIRGFIYDVKSGGLKEV
jgi:carbonic anhydrase